MSQTIQFIVSHKDTLLRTPATRPGFDHAFEQAVITRCDEYHGRVGEGTADKFLQSLGIDTVSREAVSVPDASADESEQLLF